MNTLQASTLAVSLRERYPWQILALALLFTLQSLYLAFFLTPLGDIPDESGHYSYVRDIASGTIFPLLHEAQMAQDLWGRPKEFQSTETRENWIVQHPPLYYALAAVPLAVGNLITDDPQVLSRLPRTVSAVSLGLLILVLYRTLVIAGVPQHRAFLVAPAVGFVPMVTQLSTGTTNDIFLFLLSAIATFFLVRFVMNRNLRDAYWCALWLSLAGATKMTAWVFIAPMVAILLFELRQPLWAWLRHAAGITAVSLMFPAWWMGRNFIHFGTPFYVFQESFEQVVFDYGFLDLIREHPVLDHFFAHFYGLIGFSGYCVSHELREFCHGIQMTQLSRWPLQAFTDVLFLLVLGYVVYLMLMVWWSRRPVALVPPRQSIREHMGHFLSTPWITRMLLATGVILGAALAATLFLNSQSRGGMLGSIQILSMSTAPLAGIVAAVLVLLPQSPRDRVALYGSVVFLFFGGILLYQIHQGFLINGWLRGVQGRYLYPVLPLLIVALAVALERIRVPTVFYLVVTAVLAMAFLDAFLGQVIPFYLSVRI